MAEARILGAPLKKEMLLMASASASQLRRPPVAVLLGVDFGDPRSEINVRIHTTCFEQVGIQVRSTLLPHAPDVEQTLLSLVHRANAAPEVDAVMVLLPLPGEVDVRRVISSIDPAKELEGLHVDSIMRNHPLAPPSAEPALPPIVPQATLALLAQLGSRMTDLHVAIVNSPKMVLENPVSRAIMGGGVSGVLPLDATVSIVPYTSPEGRRITTMADLVLVSVDEPRVIDGSWVRPGALVIDYNALPDPDPDGHGVIGGVDTESVLAAGASVAPIPGGLRARSAGVCGVADRGDVGAATSAGGVMAGGSLVCALAVLVGMLQGLVGGGGAMLYLLVAAHVLGGDPKAYLGAALLAAAVGSLAAALVHGFQSTVDYRRVLWILAGALLPCLMVPHLVDPIPTRYLMKSAAGVYAAVLLASVLTRRMAASTGRVRCLLLGGMCGATSSGFGVAGGSILAQAVQGGEVDAQAAVSTAAVVVAPLTLLASGGRLIQGSFDLDAALFLAGGAVIGAVCGSWLSEHIPSRWLSALTLTTSVLTILVLVSK